MKFVVAFLLVVALGVGAWFMMSPKPLQADFIIIAASEVDTLDPQKANWMTDFRVIECLYEPLLGISTSTMELEPATASKWEISDDGLTYTFHIRPEAKWSNGDPVTAEDDIYAWQRCLLPDFGSSYSSLHMHIKGAKAFYDQRTKDLEAYAEQIKALKDKKVEKIPTPQEVWEATQKHWNETVGLKAVNPATLEVTLERPLAYFLEIVAFGTYAPVHKKSVEPTVKIDETGRVEISPNYFSNPATAITNGAYVLKARSFKEHTLLAANPHYWDRANMGNESILIRVIKDEKTQLLEYRAGNAHWLPDIPTSSSMAADLVGQRDAGKRNDVHLQLGAGTYFYHFNCQPTVRGEKNPMADPRVRRALSMAIDRQTIVEKVTRLKQPVARTMTPENVGIKGYVPPAEAGVLFDPTAAKALLAEAGFPDGKGFPQGFKIMYNTDAGHEFVAQQIQQDWDKILGVKFALEGVEKNKAMEMRRGHDFAVSRGGWYGDYRDPTTFLEQFLTGDGHNDAAWSNARFDELYHQAVAETDPVKRLALLREAETIMLTEAPIAPIYQYLHLDIYDKNVVQNLNTNTWNYRQLHLVKVKKAE